MSYIKEKHNRMADEYAEEEASQYPFDPFDFGKSDKDEWNDMMEADGIQSKRGFVDLNTHFRTKPNYIYHQLW